MKFTKQQEKVIYADDPYIICVSGAGMGKTRVLTERIRRIIVEKKAKPEEIVALTFTNNAAEEMKKRLGDICYGMFIGTIHSYTNQICISCGIDTSNYLANMQFDKILSRAATIPERMYPHVKYLLMDECQDTCDLDLQVLEKIHYDNFFLVGDFRQLIYSFRGSNPEIFYRFYNDPSFKKYYLTKNFRCPPNIIKYAERFVQRFENVGPKAVAAKTIAGYIDDNISFNEVVDEILWTDNYGKWAILCRTNAELEEAQRRLDKQGIPNLTFKRGDLDLVEMEGLLSENKVKVLTIHAAKGLEFPNVVVVGMRTYNDEENRISYVAVTRAENNLYICPSIAKRRRGAGTAQTVKTTQNMIADQVKKQLIKF